MSEQGYTVTKKGLALIASIMSSEQPLIISRVMMGSGRAPEDVYIGELENLIEPVAAGTISDPVRVGSTVNMTVEYRNDLNGGLAEGFYIREFGIFAEDANGEEIMLYYGSLGDYEQFIGPWVNGRLDIRRYPISITIAEGKAVVLDQLPGVVMTAEDVKSYCLSTLLPQLINSFRTQITTHDQDENAHSERFMSKQDKLAGKKGQVIVFNDSGFPEARDFPGADSCPLVDDMQEFVENAASAANAAANKATSALSKAEIALSKSGSLITYGTSDLTDGVSPLMTGTIYAVYE